MSSAHHQIDTDSLLPPHYSQQLHVNDESSLHTITTAASAYESVHDGSPDVDGGEGETTSVKAPLLDKYGKPILLGQATLFGCTAAMTNTILGAGMLGLPHAMAESGYVLGTILLILAGVASAFALHLLSVSAKTVGTFPSSFYVVANAAVPRATWLIDLAVAIKCFGVATSYLIVIGDLMPEAIGTIVGHDSNVHHWVLDRRFWIILYMFAIILPLACLRSLNALRFTATFSIFFVCFLTGVITLYAILPQLDECAGMTLDACKSPTSSFLLDRGTLKILAVYIFGFTCHQNIFTTCNELSKFSIPRINRVISGCIGIAFVIYVLIATMSYHTYGAAVKSNILKNYPDNIALAIARILIATNVAFTFPLQCNPCRYSISLLMYQWKNRKSLMEIQLRQQQAKKLGVGPGENGEFVTSPTSPATDSSPLVSSPSATGGITVAVPTSPLTSSPSSLRHSSAAAALTPPVHIPSELRISILTILICVFSLGIAMVVSDLGVLLSIVGATGSTTISYILPGIIYLKLHAPKDWHLWQKKDWAAAILFGLGCVIIPSCLVFIFL